MPKKRDWNLKLWIQRFEIVRMQKGIRRGRCIGKKYEAYRKTQIQAGHKVSGYSKWIKIAPGSYGQPKG